MTETNAPSPNSRQLPWQGISYSAGFLLSVLLAWPIFTSLSTYWCLVLSLFYVPMALILFHAAVSCFADLSEQW